MSNLFGNFTPLHVQAIRAACQCNKCQNLMNRLINIILIFASEVFINIYLSESKSQSLVEQDA